MKGYFLIVGAGMNHCCSSQRFLNILSFCIVPTFSFYLYLCIYLFIYSFIYIYILAPFITNTKQSKKIYIYVCMCRRQNTVKFTTATKQLFCHLNIRLRRRNENTWGCHFFKSMHSRPGPCLFSFFSFGLCINENDPE